MQNTSFIQIDQLYNSGNFANIYKGILQKGEYAQNVAIKVLKSRWQSEEESILRLWDESQVLQMIESPHSIKSFGFVLFDQQPAILLDWVEGANIKELLQHSQFQFSPKMTYEIIVAVTQTLDQVFNQANHLGAPLQLIHRDIKPANIMINQNGLVKILDFGAACFDDDQRMMKTHNFEPGTIKYSPPDRCAGAPGNSQGDMFALGWTCIEMLLNQSLPQIPNDPQQYHQLLQQCMQHLQTGMPHPQWHDSVINTLQRMCAFEPSQRLLPKQVLQMFDAYAKNAQGQGLIQNAINIPIIEQSNHYPDPLNHRQFAYMSLPTLDHVWQILRATPTENMKRDAEISPPSSTQPAVEWKASQPSTIPNKWTLGDLGKKFWQQVGFLALGTFCFLHILTSMAFTIFGNDNDDIHSNINSNISSNMNSKKTFSENTGNDQSIPISLEITKENIYQLSILDSNGKKITNLKPSKKSSDEQLLSGIYTILIQPSKNNDETFSWNIDLQSNSTLECISNICRFNGEKL